MASLSTRIERTGRYQAVVILAVAFFSSPGSEIRGEDFVVFKRDREAFAKALVRNPKSTVVDTEERFSLKRAVESMTQTKGKGRKARHVNWVNREGLVVCQPFAYTIYDINFGVRPRTEPFGIEKRKRMNDVFEIDNLKIERPARQDGARGHGSWGVDSGPGRLDSRNAALFDFTKTPKGAGIGHFGADLIDFEASTITKAELRLYDDGRRVFKRKFFWRTKPGGHAEPRFLGVAATKQASFFDQIIIVLGDDQDRKKDDEPNGFRECWAADRFTFGQAYAAPRK